MYFLGSGGSAPFPFLNLKVMARRKNTETPEEVQAQEVGQVAEQAASDITTQSEETATEKPDQTIEEPTKTTEKPDQTIEEPTKTTEEPTDTTNHQSDTAPDISVEIPENVKKILASYPNYSCLYIDVKGGVYPEHTQPNLVSDAILYQNPYYKQ